MNEIHCKTTGRRARPIGLTLLMGWVVLAAAGLAWLGDALPAYAETATTKPKPETDETAIEPVRPPKPEEILRELMKRERTRPVPIPPSTPGRALDRRQLVTTTGPGPKRSDRNLHPDGTMMTDRVGRLIKKQDGWCFAFESEGKVLREPPIKLLPNRDLETMEVQSANGTRPIKFRVSGEVTVYRGENYLLLRKVLIVHEQGNLE